MLAINLRDYWKPENSIPIRDRIGPLDITCKAMAILVGPPAILHLSGAMTGSEEMEMEAETPYARSQALNMPQLTAQPKPRPLDCRVPALGAVRRRPERLAKTLMSRKA